MRLRFAHDVQRDLTFYRTAVAFRNAVELMRIIHGSVDDPNEVHWWWGFDRRDGPPPPSSRDLEDDGPTGGWGGGWDDPDDLRGSGVPRLPFGGSGAAGAEAEVPDDDDEVIDVRGIPA